MTTVVVALAPIVPVDCPDMTLVSIVLDPPNRLVFGTYSRPSPPKASTDAAGSHLFLVALARKALPAGTLTVRVMKEYQLCADCGGDSEEATFDVRPG